MGYLDVFMLFMSVVESGDIGLYFCVAISVVLHQATKLFAKFMGKHFK